MGRPQVLIRVEKYKEDKFRVSFAHTPNKKFVVEAANIDEARRYAKANEQLFFPSNNKQVTFGVFAKNFFSSTSSWAKMREAKGRKRDNEYYRVLQRRLDNYILPAFSYTKIGLIDSLAIDEWLLSLKSKRTGEALANDTVNKLIVALRFIFDEAVRQKIIDKDPMDYVTFFADNGQRRPAFTKNEIVQLFPADKNLLSKIWPTKKWLVFFIILRDTGLRPGEALALSWENYYKEMNVFVINQKLSRGKEIKPGTKTGKPRAVIISNESANYLAQYKKEMGRENGLIFSSDGTTPSTSENIIKILTGALLRAGIPVYNEKREKRTPYSFRHSFNTELLQIADNSTVQLLTGHSSDEMTAHYNHTSSLQMANKVKHMQDIIDNLYK
jgi:integrase